MLSHRLIIWFSLGLPRCLSAKKNVKGERSIEYVFLRCCHNRPIVLEVS